MAGHDSRCDNENMKREILQNMTFLCKIDGFNNHCFNMHETKQRNRDFTGLPIKILNGELQFDQGKLGLCK